MTDIANNQTNADDPYCIGRVYYEPYPHNFIWADTALLDEPGYAPSPEHWSKQNPDVSEEELKRLEDLEFPFSE